MKLADLRRQMAADPLRGLRWASFIFPLTAAMLWSIVDFGNVRAHAVQDAEEGAHFLSVYMETVIDGQTILHQAARARASHEPPQFLRSRAFHEFLAEIESTPEATLGLVLIDVAEGELVASSRTFPLDVRFGQREYAEAIVAGESLFVDRVNIEPSGEDAFVIATRYDEGGSAALVSALRILDVKRLLQRLTPLQGQAASIIRQDGKLLMRNVPSEPIILPADAPARRAMAESDSGSYTARASIDGVHRYYSFERVPGTKLFATYGIPSAFVWQQWFWRSLPVWALLALMSVISLLLVNQAQRGTALRLERQENERKMKEIHALAEQRRELMGEAHHRIKNNLALVGSLIDLSGRKGFDAPALRARIQAIAEVHDLLYRSSEDGEIDLGRLLRQLSANAALIPAERRVSVEVDCEDGLLVEARAATYVGMIVVELVTNAVKHAFAEREHGIIQIGCSEEQGRKVIIVRDDGPGIVETKQASGLRLVRSLALSLGAKLELTTDKGTEWRLSLPAAPETADISQGEPKPADKAA